ncbi:MAG TPA: adenylate/guanylate cyclase domain-containing protein [Candidatus Limnocylindrales bacterium]|jgi:class 3 adenylate cyclase|nr:adenylate/guanylate cyclase domain-containing protein [Candidatus Limnocylindrales bacterium]
MPSLGARERAGLPNSAFAYIDSRGRRMLPIHDEAHVRNALARFSRVNFEDEAGRDRARMRLLKAAKKLGIMPLGFIGGQLRPEHRLPRGQVTFALTDIEGSTELVHRLGDGYGPVLNHLRRLLRSAVQRAGGREVDARGDELFAAFERADSALDAAVAIQRGVRDHGWPDGIELRVRIGIHTGRPTLAETGYIGLAVHTVARVCTSAHGGQIVVSSAARDALGRSLPDGIALKSLGTWRLNGLRRSVELLQVRADDLLDDFPPPRPVALAVRR